MSENQFNSDETSSGMPVNRRSLKLIPGEIALYHGTSHRITEVVDFYSIVAVNQETGRGTVLPIKDLEAPPPELPIPASSIDMDEIPDEEWRMAEYRYAAIKPLLDDSAGRQEVEERAKEINVNPATLYRWLSRYKGERNLSSLVPMKPGRREGANQLSSETEKILQKVVEDYYLSHQRLRPSKIIREINRQCSNAGIKKPHPNTVRYRINKLDDRKVMRARGYADKARNKYEPASQHFPNADYPLSVVQIDHTKVDLKLVDDNRNELGRPWLTLAIDVNTRMVQGMYLSLDAPSAASVGICLAQAIMPKDNWLAARGYNVDWNIWGVMDKLHADNGPDFKSRTVRKSCLRHEIDLEFRPVKRPHFGAHIERLMGTFMHDIHTLPGATFSSVKDSEGYDSGKKACMTLSELEEWLVIHICKVYHNRFHAGIGMSPIKKWEIGIFGNDEVEGRGLPERPSLNNTLVLDFLPIFKRTVQTYGVALDCLRYYADVLRPWINSTKLNDANKKRTFTFRRDPRDISSLWFFDPELKQYFRIPLSNQAFPPMSIWEYNEVRQRLKEQGLDSENEALIIQGLNEQRAIVDASAEKTKKARRKKQRRLEHERPHNRLADEATQDEKRPAAQLLQDLSEEEPASFEDIA